MDNKIFQQILSGQKSFAPFCGPQKWQFMNRQRLEISESLRPFANDYFHPLNPAFLYEFSSLEAMLSFPVICARDGLATLLDFYCESPRPLEGGPLILVHEDLEFVVPNPWIDRTLCYRFVVNGQAAPAQKLLLYGLAQHSYTSTDYLKKILSLIPADLEVEGMLFVEDDPFFDPEEEILDAAFEIQQEISLGLKRKMRFLTYKEFLQKNQLTAYAFVDLQEQLFSMADNSCTQYLLSRGARPFFSPTRPSRRAIFTLKLSAFHQMEIFELSGPKWKRPLQEALKWRKGPLIDRPFDRDYFCALKELAAIASTADALPALQ